MKTLKTAIITLLTLAAISCTGDKAPAIPERIVEDVDTETGVISLRDYSISDTIAIGGKIFNYTYTLEHVDTLPTLINPQGLEYHENRVSIKVSRGDEQIFNKKFLKNNFKDIVPADFLKTSTMVGVNYNFTKRDEDRSALYFIVTVGDPDETSDMVFPLEVKIAPDGSYSIKKAENLETAPISTGLNIDPSEDAV